MANHIGAASIAMVLLVGNGCTKQSNDSAAGNGAKSEDAAKDDDLPSGTKEVAAHIASKMENYPQLDGIAWLRVVAERKGMPNHAKASDIEVERFVCEPLWASRDRGEPIKDHRTLMECEFVKLDRDDAEKKKQALREGHVAFMNQAATNDGHSNLAVERLANRRPMPMQCTHPRGRRSRHR